MVRQTGRIRQDLGLGGFGGLASPQHLKGGAGLGIRGPRRWNGSGGWGPKICHNPKTLDPPTTNAKYSTQIACTPKHHQKRLKISICSHFFSLRLQNCCCSMECPPRCPCQKPSGPVVRAGRLTCPHGKIPTTEKNKAPQPRFQKMVQTWCKLSARPKEEGNPDPEPEPEVGHGPGPAVVALAPSVLDQDPGVGVPEPCSRFDSHPIFVETPLDG